MALPHELLIGIVIPFIVVSVLCFFLSWIYVRYLQHHESSRLSSTLTSIIALFFVLLTTALVPIDVFVASFFKNNKGEFKDWVATTPVDNVENAILYSYYVLYGILALMVFLVMPFVYFYVEEKEDDMSTKQTICSALKYTIGFVFVMVIVLAVGAFAPLKQPPKNMTAIDDKLKYLGDELKHFSDVQTSMSFLIGCLSVLGTLMLVAYAAFGMSAFPLTLIKCSCCLKTMEDDDDDDDIQRNRLSRRERDAERARMIRAKANAGRTLSSQELRTLSTLEQEERLFQRMDRRSMAPKKNGCLGGIQTIFKPFTIVFGIVYLICSLLIITALLITNIDKTMHSPGYKYGYALPNPTIPNPIEKIMLFAQKVFPLDYVFFTLIVATLLFSSMSGLKKMGIWCFCVKLFRIRAHRTLPQAILLMIFVLMFMVLAMNSMLFSIMPQYMVYGSQFYRANVTNPTHHNGTHHNGTHHSVKVTSCSRHAPSGACTMTRIAVMMDKLNYKIWFFGAFYYWAAWVFIGVFFIGSIVTLVLIRRPPTEGANSDVYDSDDEPLIQA